MISYASFAFFLLYFGITFLIYCIMPQKAKWVVLLVGSFFFYFVSCKSHIWALLIATNVIWIIGMLIEAIDKKMKAKRKLASKDEKKAIKKKYTKIKQFVLAIGVLGTLGTLLVLKYTNFFIETTNSIFSTEIGQVNVIQPLGISFFTLQAISYLTDVHHGKYPAEKNPFRVTLYLSFMLTVVEGPIARYDQFGSQLKVCAKFNPSNIVYGAQRVVWGLIKKVIVADRAAMFVGEIFDNSTEYHGLAIMAGIMFYTLQLYFEFSGIMDVVCGLGEMMGLKLPENFNRPFFAKSINEFWQRWHITLGSWLRDYIFYPISLSKPFMNLSKTARKKFNPYYANLIPTAVALFFVWFSNGFWHGSGWKYITYGLYYYVLMMIGLFMEPLFRKLCTAIKLDRDSKGFHVFQVARTFVIVNIGMLIFRADTLEQATSMFKSMFVGLNAQSLQLKAGTTLTLDALDYLVIALGTALVITISAMQEKGIDIRLKIAKLPFVAKFVLFMAMIFAVIFFGAYGEGYGVVDLIYANF